MFRRLLLALLAALLLMLAPSAAFADDYDGNNGDNVSTDNPNPEPGEVFGVQVESDDCRVVRLTSSSPRSETEIDGKQTNTRTKPGDEDGTTDYRVAIDVEGEFTLTAYCVSEGNEVLGVQAIAVGDGDAAGTTAGNTRQAGLLPDTGADSTTTALTVGGGLLLLAGATTLLLRRRNTDAG